MKQNAFFGFLTKCRVAIKLNLAFWKGSVCHPAMGPAALVRPVLLYIAAIWSYSLTAPQSRQGSCCTVSSSAFFPQTCWPQHTFAVVIF